jgi:hypothetical protein
MESNFVLYYLELETRAGVNLSAFTPYLNRIAGHCPSLRSQVCIGSLASGPYPTYLNTCHDQNDVAISTSLKV